LGTLDSFGGEVSAVEADDRFWADSILPRRRTPDWLESTYSVEKLETNDDAIFRQRERAGIDWPLTCIQADARARTEASAAT